MIVILNTNLEHRAPRVNKKIVLPLIPGLRLQTIVPGVTLPVPAPPLSSPPKVPLGCHRDGRISPMNTLETLVPSMVELLAAENQNFFHFASSQSPHLERASLYETAAPSLSMETLFAIRQEKERASGQEKLLLKLIEAAFLRFQERGKTLPHIDNLLNALSISGIEFPTEKGNFWQAAATLRELEQGEGRQQIGVLVDRRASQSMDLCARILEGRLGLCEEQEWKDAQERCCVLWATPYHLADDEVDSLLSLTNDSYRDLLSYFSQKLVGESPATLKAVDLPRLLNSPAFDPIFSQEIGRAHV